MARFARIGAAVAATALTVGLAAPAAQAQTNIVGIITGLNNTIDGMNCNVLRLTLNTTGLVDADTTRGELVSALRKAVGNDPQTVLVTSPTITKIGDRALECKIVKADPVTPMDQAVNFSSELSAQAGLPELRNLLPVLGF